MEKLDYHSVDWAALWQQAKKFRANKAKKERDWDSRAQSFARRTASSIYTDRFIDLLAPSPHWTILDVGSGPGTIALPLASHVRHITCIDFSGEMLSILHQRARQQGSANITSCKISWEEDWGRSGIRPHSVVIASRSLAVQDLKAAIQKLCGYATEKVVVTDKVRHGPFDPDAFRALQRPLETGPDYIYTINLLYQMGYHAAVNFIHLSENPIYGSFSDAMTGYTAMFPAITAEEKKQLKKYLQSITTTGDDGQVTVHRKHTPTWAFISWDPTHRDL